jgi:hypothetical protein
MASVEPANALTEETDGLFPHAQCNKIEMTIFGRPLTREALALEGPGEWMKNSLCASEEQRRWLNQTTPCCFAANLVVVGSSTA